jgi:hypothetical protein
LLGVGVAFTLALAGSPASMAGSPNVDIQIGVPGVGGGVYGEEDYDSTYRRRRISCGEARMLVRDRGYIRVRMIDCGGRRHTFSGFRRGRLWLVTVNAFNGSISRRPY